MKGELNSEYDLIKLLREIQIVRELNQISDKFFGTGVHPFVPKLIDILTLDQNDLSQLAIVMEFEETDLDKLMKSKIDF